MSRKKGVIENPDWEDELKNDDNIPSNQDKDTQNTIDEMYKKLNNNQENNNEKLSAEESNLNSNSKSEDSAPVKTLWEIAMEESDNESEYEDDDPLYKKIIEKTLCILKKAATSTLIFLKKSAASLVNLLKKITIKIKEKKNNRANKPKDNNKKTATIKKNENSKLIEKDNGSTITKKDKRFIITKKNKNSPAKIDKYNEEIEENEEDYPVKKKGSSTSEVAFIGASKGVGTTYSAFLCASVLSKKYKVCVLEQNDTGHFSSIFEYLNSEIPYQRKMFKYKGIDYYFNINYDQFIEEFRSKYDFVIVDYSFIEDIDDYIQIARSDKVFALIDGTYWRLNEIKNIIIKLKERDRSKSIIYLNPIREPIADIKKICFPNKITKIPYAPNPFKPDKTIITLFYKIFKIKI